MFSRRRLLLALTAMACLLGVPGAAADTVNSFTAVAGPSAVKPATAGSYALVLTNDPSSPDSADAAKIGIPTGFVVDAASVQATTSAAGICRSSTWVADGELVAGGKINLRRPGDSAEDDLCPGATLTLQFTSTSASAEGMHVWTSELSRGLAAFTIAGAQPATRVDGTPPAVSITAAPATASNSDSSTFEFVADEPATFECKLDGNAFLPCSSPRGYAGLPNGSHAFAVRATDAAGNTGPGATHTWTVDTAAPAVAISQKPANPSRDNSPSFAFAANEAASFECKLDGAALAPCSSPKAYAALADGSHTFAVAGTDAAGNTATATHIWTVDTDPPTAAVTSSPNALTNSASATFAVAADEPATFECKLDASTFGPCGSSKSYAGLADGSHTFAVRATDAAGNTGPETTFTWTIDTTPPTSQITGKPADPSNDGSPSFAFSAGEAAQFQCKLDGGAFVDCSSPQTYPALADGLHTFSVKATDNAGNTGAVKSYSWTIDRSPPTVSITEKPADQSRLASPRFAFTASEAGSTFACKLDTAAFAPCSSPKDYAGLADGAHTFAVRATDAAGNTSAVQTHAWTVDTVAPTVTITDKPANPSKDASPSFAFSPSESGSQFVCRLDGSSFTSCVSAKSYTGLADGPHTFGVKAMDAAGNSGAETSYGWTIDTVPPTAAITGKPANPSKVSAPSFSFTASQAGSSFACRIDGGAFSACVSPKGYTLVDGNHTFVVTATDPAGNTSSETSYTWTIDTVAPVAAITGKPSDPSNNTRPRFTFSASESGSQFECKLDGGGFAACSSPRDTGPLTPGEHTFAVRATDAAGNIGPDESYQWTVDLAAPTVEITQKPTDPSKSGAASFTFTASQANSSFECRLDNQPFAACSSPKSYTGLVDGSHTFAVTATDPAGNKSAATSYTWRVDTLAPTATLGTKPKDPDNDPTPRFAFAASESGSTFECKLDAGLFGACTSPQDLGPLAQGAHTFAVRATDLAGNTGAATSHSWTIDTTAPVTTITASANGLTNNRAASFTFAAGEPSTFECRLDGASFEACSSPKAYAAVPDGSHTFGVRAKDLAGNTGVAATRNWTIDATAPTIAISGKPVDPSNNSSPTFDVTAGEPVAFRCKLDDSAFVACGATKTYANVAQGRHTFTAEATDPAGNTAQASYSWTVDTTAPTATITQKPSNQSNTGSTTFAFASNEIGAAFACRLEQGGFEPCAPPKSYAGLLDGQHAFAVRATDAAGNVGAADTYTWTVDTIAPTVTISTKPSDPSNTRSASFSFAASEDDTSAVCSLDGAAFGACTSPLEYGGLTDGPHTFAVKAVDAAGNVGAEKRYGWTIETRPPTASVTSAPSALSASSSAVFAFTADEPSAFDCKLDDRGFEPCGSPATYYGLGNGGHAFAVRARDAVGNVGAAAAYSWTIDTAAPETTLASAPPSATTATAATFSFSASENATFECRLDGAPFALCGPPKTYTGLSRSTHEFEVRAVDTAGNADVTPAVYAWKIGAPVSRAVTSSLLSPSSGARVTRPPRLVWRRVARARYYNVQLFRGTRKIFTAWPIAARLQLRQQWTYAGRKQQLLPGRYRWYVWPGFGQPSTRRYGQLLGQSTFVVVRRSARR